MIFPLLALRVESFERELHSIVSAIVNISLERASTCSQATLPVGFGGLGIRRAIHLAPSAFLASTLPVGFGGLGIRRAIHLAPSAFLASAAGYEYLIVKILPRQVQSSSCTAVEVTCKEWSGDHDQSPPPTPANIRQKAWDKPWVHATFKVLLVTVSDPQAQERLLATTTKESGAWLHALQISSLELKMDDEVMRNTVGHPRHTAINELIQR